MAKIFLSLGSNLGEREKFLLDAVESLSPNISNIRISSVYQTDPWGKTDQPKFLNLCISGSTNLEPEELLAFAKKTEKRLGRRKSIKFGPRQIDIDILFYDNLVLDKPSLRIPHPLIEQRAFVLIPLAEIAPDFVHPVLNKSIKELASKIDQVGIDKIGRL